MKKQLIVVWITFILLITGSTTVAAVSLQEQVNQVLRAPSYLLYDDYGDYGDIGGSDYFDDWYYGGNYYGGSEGGIWYTDYWDPGDMGIYTPYWY